MTQKEFDIQMTSMSIENDERTKPMFDEIYKIKEERKQLSIQRIAIDKKTAELDIKVREITNGIEQQNREYRKKKNDFVINYLKSKKE